MNWKQLLSIYKDFALLSKATLPMVRAIWNEMLNIALKKASFRYNYVFRSFPGLEHIIKSIKANRQNPVIRALVIVDPDLANETAWEAEAVERARIYIHFIATQLRIPVCLNATQYWNAGHLRHFVENMAVPELCPFFDRKENKHNNRINDADYLAAFDELIHSKIFVIIYTFNDDFYNALKNKDGVMVINLQQTLQDRLVTLEALTQKYSCEPEIVKNLDAINQIIPQQVITPAGRVSPIFKMFDYVIRNASNIFLTDRKFDTKKAQKFFAEPQWFLSSLIEQQ